MLPNGNFLCVVAVIDLRLGAMVEAFIFNLTKHHVIIQWELQTTGVMAGILRTEHYENQVFLYNSNLPEQGRSAHAIGSILQEHTLELSCPVCLAKN